MIQNFQGKMETPAESAMEALRFANGMLMCSYEGPSIHKICTSINEIIMDLYTINKKTHKEMKK